MTRFVRLIRPEPYRASGANTAKAPVVTQTLSPRHKPRHMTRKVAHA